MKRILMLALASVCLLLPGFVEASVGLAPERVFWRSSASVVNGYVDSASTCGSVARADTSAPINKAAWPIPEFVAGAADTITYYTFVYQRAKESVLTEAEDSLQIAVQVSWDGVNWFTTGAGTTAGTGLDVNAAASVAAQVSLLTTTSPVIENGTSGTFTGSAKLQVGGPIGLQGADPTTATVSIGYLGQFGYPYIRFIVDGDPNGCYEAFIHHWQTLPIKNQ